MSYIYMYTCTSMSIIWQHKTQSKIKNNAPLVIDFFAHSQYFVDTCIRKYHNVIKIKENDCMSHALSDAKHHGNYNYMPILLLSEVTVASYRTGVQRYF